MELVANVWPIVDSHTGIVQRYLMRAYAMQTEDSVISDTLQALAPSDYVMARPFTVPSRYKLTSDHGTIEGAVTIGQFHESMQDILSDTYKVLEADYNRFQGLDATGRIPAQVTIIPRFPDNPYTVVTTVLEMPNGELIPKT